MRSEINAYLLFGYSLDFQNPDYKIDFSGVDKGKYSQISEKDAVREGIRKLESVFDDLYVPGEDIVVPLSGGVDSRLILAFVSRFREVSGIRTFTFGTPGTLDYDIGNRLAKQYGTRHTSFPLDQFTYNMDELIDISRRFRYQSPLFIHPPVWKLEELYPGCTIWSGVNAGAVVGSFILQSPSRTILEAKTRFLRKGAFVKSLNLCTGNASSLIQGMDFEAMEPEVLTYDEQVFFTQRSEKHLAPNVLIKGFHYKTPFINNQFMDFMLSQRKAFRLGKHLYKRIAYHAFPDFFTDGIEGNYGFRIDSRGPMVELKRKWHSLQNKMAKRLPKYWRYTSPMINYIDFNEGIRKRKDLKKIVCSSIHDLKARNLVTWIDPEEIFNRHLAYKGNHADALIALASLETHLKAGKKLEH